MMVNNQETETWKENNFVLAIERTNKRWYVNYTSANATNVRKFFSQFWKKFRRIRTKTFYRDSFAHAIYAIYDDTICGHNHNAFGNQNKICSKNSFIFTLLPPRPQWVCKSLNNEPILNLYLPRLNVKSFRSQTDNWH